MAVPGMLVLYVRKQWARFNARGCVGEKARRTLKKSFELNPNRNSFSLPKIRGKGGNN